VLEGLLLWRAALHLLSSGERGCSPVPRGLQVVLSLRTECGAPILGGLHGKKSSGEIRGAPIPEGLHVKKSSGEIRGALLLHELKKKFKGAHQLLWGQSESWISRSISIVIG